MKKIFLIFLLFGSLTSYVYAQSASHDLKPDLMTVVLAGHGTDFKKTGQKDILASMNEIVQQMSKIMDNMDTMMKNMTPDQKRDMSKMMKTMSEQMTELSKAMIKGGLTENEMVVMQERMRQLQKSMADMQSIK